MDHKNRLKIGLANYILLKCIFLFFSLIGPLAFANSGVSVSTEVVQSPVGPAIIAITVVNGHEASKDFLENDLPGAADGTTTRIMVSDFKEYAGNADPEHRKITKKERVESIVMATILSSIKSVAILYVSKLPSDPAMTTVLVSTFFNFYFNWDVERWSNFLYRWQNLSIKGAEKLGLKKVSEHRVFQEAAKNLAGFVGTATFGFIYVGISMWDQFFAELAATPGPVLNKVLLASLKTFLMAQPFDNVFSRWIREGHSTFSRDTIHNMMRAKSLLMTGLTPLIYSGYAPADTVSKIIFGAGLSLLAWDYSGPAIKQRVKISWSSMKDSVKGLFNKKSKASDCESNLTP